MKIDKDTQSDSITRLIVENNKYAYSTPARVCAICNNLEFNSDICRDDFWICPKCLKKLRTLLEVIKE